MGWSFPARFCIVRVRIIYQRSDNMGKAPEPGEGKRGVEGYLGYLLRQAAGAHRNRAERALADIGVTPPQFTVLTMLAAYPGQSNADLARLALLTPQTVNLIVANLEKAGAVSRRPHAVHGRIRQIELTARGRTLLAAARKRMHGLEREISLGPRSRDEQIVRRWLVDVARAPKG
jgi:DNA-binding MarR family transcriptional regulator